MSEPVASRLIEGAREALAVARGEIPAAAIIVNGHRYVPATELQEARDKVMSAREFVKRHPALTLIDLAEFEAYLKIPAALKDGESHD